MSVKVEVPSCDQDWDLTKQCFCLFSLSYQKNDPDCYLRQLRGNSTSNSWSLPNCSSSLNYSTLVSGIYWLDGPQHHCLPRVSRLQSVCPTGGVCLPDRSRGYEQFGLESTIPRKDCQEMECQVAKDVDGGSCHYNPRNARM